MKNDYTEKFRIQRFRGSEAKKYSKDIARLRIEVFYEFPYLYEGSESYEERYLETYFGYNQSAIILCFDAQTNKVVGASTALPLEYEIQTLKQPFIDAGLNEKEIFYYGESVLQKNYRGLGIGKLFFLEREKAAREHGSKYGSFCAVVRPTNHPARPEGYRPLDEFWKAQGYTQQDKLVGSLSWKDIGEEKDSPKAMQFWMKTLK